MPTTTESIETSEADLQKRIAEAIEDSALPISQLLRLMWALDADQTAVNQNLRARLRNRIGAPLSA